MCSFVSFRVQGYLLYEEGRAAECWTLYQADKEGGKGAAPYRQGALPEAEEAGKRLGVATSALATLLSESQACLLARAFHMRIDQNWERPARIGRALTCLGRQARPVGKARLRTDTAGGEGLHP